MHHNQKCKLAVCACEAKADDSFCSDYCRQAVSQGLDRDFCQCTHATCTEHTHVSDLFDTAGLPGSITVAPGLVTIVYSDQRDLCDQLSLLAAKLYAESETSTHMKAPPSRALSIRAGLGQSA